MQTSLNTRVVEQNGLHLKNSFDSTGDLVRGVSRTAEDAPSQPQNDQKEAVAIVLGYYNGHRYIADQLNSIYNQSRSSFQIFLYDDQSSNPFTLQDLDLKNNQKEKITVIRRSKRTGFANNFLGALSEIDNKFEYFSFCDQDDIWRRQKLEKAIKVLSNYPAGEPALYCARTEITDCTGKRTTGKSPLFRRPPTFANALIQNIGGGNTMVFNKAARDLIVSASPGPRVVSHDWWCYQIVAGAGGHVIYDAEPCLKYRQHDANLIGENTGWKARLKRVRGLLNGEFRSWNDANIKALEKNHHLLTPDNRHILDDFSKARRSALPKRIVLFRRSGVHRQTFFGNLGLLVGVLLKKV